MAITKPDVTAHAWAELAAGSPDIVTPADSEIQTGWPLTSSNPPRGFFNWLLKQCHMGVRYLMRWGISDWDATEIYAVGAIVRDSYLENSFTRRSYFQAVGTPTSTAPHLDTTNWAIILELPIAQATNYRREIMSWRNARGIRRFAINHLGFPGGKLIRWQEDWANSATTVTATNPGTGTLQTRWLTSVFGTGAAMSITGPSALVLSQSACLLQQTGTGAVTPQTAHVESAPIMLNDGSDSFTWQCDAGTLVAGFWDHNNVTIGVQGASAQGSNLDWIGIGSALGLVFKKDTGGANWQAYAKGTVGGSTSVDTGVAADGTIHRFGIDYQGTGDGGSGQAVFFIDGNVVATITISFAAGTMSWSAFCHTFHASSGNGGTFIQGVVDWVSALWGSTDIVR